MPVRTIQKIDTYVDAHKENAGRYYISIHPETWNTYELERENTIILCEINRLLDRNRKSIFRGNKKGEMLPWTWKGTSGRIHYDLIFSRDFVKSVGLRSGWYVDMLLTDIKRSDGDEKIYPNSLISDLIHLHEKSSKVTENEIYENIIDHEFSDSFFARLTIEINRANSYGLFSSTMMLLRKLMENLLIELLRTQFGRSKVEKFFSTDKGRFHDFSTLLENFEKEINSFKPYSSSFEKSMIVFLDKFREKANSATHSIDIKEDWNYIMLLKEDLNHYSEIFEKTIEKIKSNPK